MPVLVLLGENEFAFDIRKSDRRARKCIQHLEMEKSKFVEGDRKILIYLSNKIQNTPLHIHY